MVIEQTIEYPCY